MRRTIRPLVSCVLALALAASALRAEVPTLAFSSFLGGDDVDSAYAVTTDAAGFVYLAGVTLSSDYPDPHPVSAGAEHEVFVVKLDSAGRLVWKIRFGGSRNELPTGIAVSRDRVWVTGWTNSADFPLRGPLVGQTAVAGEHDAFVTSLAIANGALLSSTNLGGSDDDVAEGIAVDARGDVYVTGTTSSPDFPVVAAPGTSGSAVYQPFVAKLSADGARLVYSRPLGGTSGGSGQAVAVDAAGHAYVTGYTYSHDFPLVHAAQAAWGGGLSEGFVTKVAPSGGSLVWSTFLGGGAEEGLQGIALDSAGRAWVTGWTSSPNFPLRSAFQRSLGGEFDAVVAGFGPGGGLIASSFLGGGQAEVGEGIATDSNGGLRVVGGTSSDDFPVVDALQAECGLPEPVCADAFVAELRPGAAGVSSATYLGGEDASYAWGVAVDAQGNTWTVGVTEAADFPQAHPLQPFADGIADAWISKLAAGGGNRPPDCSRAASLSGLLWPANGKLRPIAIGGVTDPDGDFVTLAVRSIRQDEPLSKKGRPDASGLGTSRPMVRADRAGNGDGRVYHLRFTAEDGQGGRCEAEVTVCVPRDQGRKTCGDGGPLYDSTR